MITKATATGQLVAALCLVLLTVPALADDWVVTKLKGVVLAHDGVQWVPLSRGDVVSDDRLVSTLDGRVMFVRGREVVELKPGTTIQIMDRIGEDHTMVVNHEGEVNVSAQARDVQHFSVVTPHLVAVVKGTMFSVRNTAAFSELRVEKGEVRMRDTAFDTQFSVSAGYGARTGSVPAKPTLLKKMGKVAPAASGANSGSRSTPVIVDPEPVEPDPLPEEPEEPPPEEPEVPDDPAPEEPDDDGDDDDDDGDDDDDDGDDDD